MYFVLIINNATSRRVSFTIEAHLYNNKISDRDFRDAHIYFPLTISISVNFQD